MRGEGVTSVMEALTLTQGFIFAVALMTVVSASFLLKMGRKDYDSAGTAEMIVDSLKETLGLTSSQLARKLLHAR